MNATEKRNYIQSHLHQIDDQTINELFNAIYSGIVDKNEDLSTEIKAALNQGLSSLEQGKSSSHEEVMMRMRKKYPSLIK